MDNSKDEKPCNLCGGTGLMWEKSIGYWWSRACYCNLFRDSTLRWSFPNLFQKLRSRMFQTLKAKAKAKAKRTLVMGQANPKSKLKAGREQ